MLKHSLPTATGGSLCVRRCVCSCDRSFHLMGCLPAMQSPSHPPTPSSFPLLSSRSLLRRMLPRFHGYSGVIKKVATVWPLPWLDRTLPIFFISFFPSLSLFLSALSILLFAIALSLLFIGLLSFPLDKFVYFTVSECVPVCLCVCVCVFVRGTCAWSGQVTSSPFDLLPSCLYYLQ